MNWGELKQKTLELEIPDTAEVRVIVEGLPKASDEVWFDSRISTITGVPVLYIQSYE